MSPSPPFSLLAQTLRSSVTQSDGRQEGYLLPNNEAEKTSMFKAL